MFVQPAFDVVVVGHEWVFESFKMRVGVDRYGDKYSNFWVDGIWTTRNEFIIKLETI